MTPLAKRMFVAAGVVALLVLLVGLIAMGPNPPAGMRAPRGPASLAFLGYTRATNGSVLANLQFSNVSGKAINYTAGGSNVLVPGYFLEIPPKNPKPGIYKPGTNAFFAPTWTTNTDLELAAGASVTFSVPMALGPSNVSIYVSYDPNGRPGMVRMMMENLRLLVLGHSASWRQLDSVGLQLPTE